MEEIDIDPREVARHEAYAAAKKQKRPQNGRKKNLSPDSSLDDRKKVAVFVKASDSEAESTSSVTSSSTGGENFEQNINSSCHHGNVEMTGFPGRGTEIQNVYFSIGSKCFFYLKQKVMHDCIVSVSSNKLFIIV